MKIKFAIWVDQQRNFDQFCAQKLTEEDIEVTVDQLKSMPAKGWVDYTVTGLLYECCKLFHVMGREGYNLAVYRDNPVEA